MQLRLGFGDHKQLIAVFQRGLCSSSSSPEVKTLSLVPAQAQAAARRSAYQ